jgi:uncharacterized protein
MSEIDQQFIEFVVKSLVGKPDAVQIKRTIDEKGVLLELTVDPEDLGRVIGKRGATAQSLRTLLRALGTKNDARYNLKIVDNGVDHPKAGGRDDSRTKDDAADTAAVENEASAVSDDGADEADTATSDNSEKTVSETEPEEVAKAGETDDQSDDDQAASDRLRKTREELADLDDLDV